MKCPLLAPTFRTVKGEMKLLYPDCIKEECAWWRGDHEECAILGLSYQLEALACALVTVQKNMPRVGQFTK